MDNNYYCIHCGSVVKFEYKQKTTICPDCQREIAHEDAMPGWTREARINQLKAMHNMMCEANDENIYTRNKVRNIVLPYIEKEFNPNILTSLERLSDIAKEQEEYLKLQTDKYYEEVCISEEFINGKQEITIDLKQFNLLEKIIQKRIILHAINKIFGTTQGIEKIHIDDIIKLCNNNIGNKYLTPNKNVKIVTQKKQLKIIDISC